MRKFWYSILVGLLILNVVNISNFAALESPLIPSLQEPTFQNVFAQSDDEDENEEGDEGEHEDESEEGEDESQDEESGEHDEELEIQVEIKDGVAKVEIEHNDEDLEFELDTTDEDAIIDEIVTITGLTKAEVEAVIEFEIETDEGQEEIEDEDIEEEEIDDLEDVEEHDESDETDESDEETEIQVEIKNTRTKVEIEHNGEESKFILDTTDENEILSIIIQKTGLSESQIREIWELEVESEDAEDDSDESEHDAKITQKKQEAIQDAQERLAELESQILELEQRIQDLLEKLQSGQYFGNLENIDDVTKSFSMSFDGNAISIQDESEAIISGDLFFETQYTNQNISKLRITGGEIIVGDTSYDVMFGKARISSSGPSGVKDSMIVIGEVVDQEGNMSTIRLSIDSQVPLDVDFGQEPIDIQIVMPSKIAKQWSLEATGQMELLL